MSKIKSVFKKAVKNLLWLLVPKKNGASHLKVLGGPARGCILNLDLRLEGSYWLGNYDDWIFAGVPFEKFIKKGDVVWDGGAYVGYYTAYFRKLAGKEGTVHSFEASSTNYERLKSLPQSNGWNNVFIHNLAIGPDHTQISFVNNLGGANGPYGLDKKYKEDSVAVKIEKVQSCGVDELIEEMNISTPDFIKFDLESAEEFALANGDVLFSLHKPFLLLELHGEKARDAAGIFLEKFGYEAKLPGEFAADCKSIRTLIDLKSLNYIPHMIFCSPINK